MPIDFPTGPTEDQIYTYEGKSWIYNGTAWDVAALPLRSTLEYLVIGGGGGGGMVDTGAGGGGGGAGGYRTNVAGELSGGSSPAEPSMSFALNTPYAVTVGAGGASSVYVFGYQPGFEGNRSRFYVVTSQGGGGGANHVGQRTTGGSGGGGYTAWFGLGLIGEGSNGGSGTTSQSGGAGGGGAGAVGVNATSAAGTNGGAGLASSITGSSVTRGGGAGGGGGSTSGTGGAGGGGNGGRNGVNPTNGAANTGGGGGGVTNTNSGAGGSGLVVLRYPAQFTITIGAGLTGSTATVGANKVTTFTAGTGNVSWE